MALIWGWRLFEGNVYLKITLFKQDFIIIKANTVRENVNQKQV